MENHNGEEKRKSPRFPFREDVLIDGAKQCTCNEISEGGLFISAIQVFDKDEMIEITISVGEERIRVKGQIRYCQHGIGVGVMFQDLTEEHKVKIKTLVDSVSAKSP